MSLRFSESGPEFPRELVDAIIGGEVVFLCGAGVSAPQLPSFKQLVERTYLALNMVREPSEVLSFEAGRYEEVLGSLGRRLADPEALERAVVNELRTPAAPDLDNHKTVVRLSRDLNNRPAAVTTNFDNLFEMAWLSLEPETTIENESFAGQALPPPGSASFGGIIHIHGRLADDDLGLGRTPLVMTSADYGDAYMRSGWASRFLFDLVRCKTVVMLGYSAGDAPVRYFLNVLEADRARFRDLRPVYAFDAVRGDADDPDARWSALAVTPIAYTATRDEATGVEDHSSLWTDLAALAEVVERPKRQRRQRAEAILARPRADVSDGDIKELAWLYQGRTDLRDVLINTVSDAEWFTAFHSLELWPEADASWAIPAWIARDWTDRDRVEVALYWHRRLGKPFIDHLARRLGQSPVVPLLWRQIWRLICTSKGQSGDDLAQHYVEQALRGEVTLDVDLRDAVDLLTPDLEIGSNKSHLYGETIVDPPERVSNVIWPRLRLDDKGGLHELLPHLLARRADAERLLEIGTDRLRSSIATACDAEMIVDEWDGIEGSVPSIEAHAQNDHHDGVIYLVRLLADVLPAVTDAAPDAARQIAESWRGMRGRVGLRLWLHALRDPRLYSADEVANGVLSISLVDFWNIKRELALVIRDRMGDAAPELIEALERRILVEGDAYYARYEVEPGQIDWRAHAKDAAVWLRLKMLEAAGVVSGAGRDELTAISERREYLRRDVEDRDFFGSYSSGVTRVIGDPTPIKLAPEADRIQVALDSIQSDHYERRQGWSAFCSSDPEGAFSTLAGAELVGANAELWNGLIASLSFTSGGTGSAVAGLRVRIFQHLENSDDFLGLVADRLVDLLWSVDRNALGDSLSWWERLWEAISRNAPEADDVEDERDLLSDALNTPAGRLAQILVNDLDAGRKANTETEELVARVQRAAATQGRQGLLACAIFVQDAPFILSFDRPGVANTLRERLSGGQGAAALRSILLVNARVTKTLNREFSAQILQAALEWSGDHHADHPASKLLLPALRIMRGDDPEEDWGTTIDDAARVLRDGHPSFRVGAAQLLSQWAREDEQDRAGTWRRAIGPLIRRVWPKDRRFRASDLTSHLVGVVVNAGDAFPEAFSELKPYMAPAAGRGSYAISRSDVAERFPSETLQLLWLVAGPNSSGTVYEMPKLLDRIVAAKPSLEVDRRFQWLEHRAVRFD